MSQLIIQVSNTTATLKSLMQKCFIIIIKVFYMKFILLDDTSDINDNVNNSTILHNIPSTSLK